MAALNQFGSRHAGQITALQFAQIQSAQDSQNSRWYRLAVGGSDTVTLRSSNLYSEALLSVHYLFTGSGT